MVKITWSLYLLAFMILWIPNVYGEDITYDGTNPPLQNAPAFGDILGRDNILFPGSAVAPGSSGNSVTVDYSVGTSPNEVVGGLSNVDSTRDNKVTLVDGLVGGTGAGTIFGGYGWGVLVKNNIVNISGGRVGASGTGYIYGGYSDRDVSGNAVVMTAGVVGDSQVGYIYGGESRTGSANYNTVTLSGGTVGAGGSIAFIYGGFARSNGTAIGNRVIISGGTVGTNADFTSISAFIYGGYSYDGLVSGNSVIITNGTVGDDADGSVYGGYSNNNAVNNNSVIISGGLVSSKVRGGYSRNMGGAAGNTVEVSGGTVKELVCGAYTENGVASGNSVKITGGVIDNRVYGADAVFSGDVVYNKVEISGSSTEIGVDVLGASTTFGLAAGNSVLFANGWVKGNIHGGVSHGALSVRNNSVTITNGKVGTGNGKGSIHGGTTYSGPGKTVGNQVLISGDSTTIQGDIYGGSSYGSGEVSGNTVTIHGGVMNSVFGGYAPEAQVSGEVKNNQVFMYGGNISLSSIVVGGYSNASDATGNSVLVDGGNIYDGNPGNSGGEQIIGGMSSKGNANENSVTIKSGIVGGNIYGGRGMVDAKNNTVSLFSAAIIDPSARVYGGEGNGDATSGNTLNIDGFSGQLAGVHNFENYNFSVSTLLANNGNILTVTNPSDISGTTTSVNFLSGDKVLQGGELFTLIKNVGGAPEANIDDYIQARHGALLYYDLTVFSDNDNSLYARVRSAQAAPEAKSIAEGRIGSLAFLNQGHDLIVDSGFSAANASLGTTGEGWSTPTFFGTVGGSHFRHKTGSHVDVDGVSTLLGMTWRNNGPRGSLLLGAFFETGYADYDTRNAFASGSVRGDGDSRHFGGGFMGRYDWHNGIYAEVTARAGSIHNKFHSDLTDASGTHAKYDINSPYFGAHAGVGYKWQMTERASVDFSAKYLWSRQNSDTAEVTGSTVDFDATNSHRLRTGARYSFALNDCIKPYVGAAFEYEFSGKARAAVSDYAFGVPSLKGGTGIGEIGLTVRRNSFTTDLGVQGHFGRRDGITGSVRVEWSF